MSIPVLDPAGPIGQKERGLIILAVALSAIVVIPVYLMLVSFAWRYREGNKKARYNPDFYHSRVVETIWWGVPLIIISVLAVVTWRSSYDLSPFKSLAAKNDPLTIQVVALPWRWLFIYPQQNIAVINLAEFPVDTPVDFEIASDAPMNSFWIPQLGGQIYAMDGMQTSLHLMADRIGAYHGWSANISGEGFAGMEFTAKSVTQNDFNQWAHAAAQKPNRLTLDAYNKLAKPSMDNQISYYSSVEAGLFDHIVMKFMDPSMAMPEGQNMHMQHMGGQ